MKLIAEVVNGTRACFSVGCIRVLVVFAFFAVLAYTILRMIFGS